MAQIFHPSTNTIARVSVFGGVFIVTGLAWAAWELSESSYVTRANIPIEQPVPFSHKHHVTDDGIDCRYCHTSVEDSSFAGLPSTKTCMNCHAEIWSDAPMLAPVRQSYRTGQPLRWIRVNYLPQFVYFDHSIHVHKGVGCTTCHGPVGEMPLTWQARSLHMRWCLECHRQPANYLRPRDRVFDPDWQPPADQPAQGRRLAEEYHANSRTDCTTCHR